MKKIFYYTKIWFKIAGNSIANWTANGKVLLVFLLGKIIRLAAYFGFVYFLLGGSGGLLNYSREQVIFFMTTYVFIDTVAQFFFRNVYSFRQLIVSGDFDLVLVKPMSALFRSLLGGPDPIDLITIPPIIILLIWAGSLLSPVPIDIIAYLILLVNSIIIACSFHIFVLGFGIITLEVDHMVMVYRDLTSMGRFPVDIYKEPLNWFLTYLIPVGIMFTVPGRALAGLVKPGGIILSFIFGVLCLYLSLRFWQFALKRYTSASS